MASFTHKMANMRNSLFTFRTRSYIMFCFHFRKHCHYWCLNMILNFKCFESFSNANKYDWLLSFVCFYYGKYKFFDEYRIIFKIIIENILNRYLSCYCNKMLSIESMSILAKRLICDKCLYKSIFYQLAWTTLFVSVKSLMLRFVEVERKCVDKPMALAWRKQNVARE